LDYKTFVDYNDDRLRALEEGSVAEREELWKETETYLRKHHHRPLLERQRRARAEYNACSLRDGSSRDFPSFLAEFRKCVKNLERAKLTKPPEELKVDFLEKVPEECATYLMLTPWRDDATGETHLIRTVDEAQSMARAFFAIKGAQRQFEVEEVQMVKGAGKTGGNDKKGSETGPQKCSSCGGVGHLAFLLPDKGWSEAWSGSDAALQLVRWQGTCGAGSFDPDGHGGDSSLAVVRYQGRW
jgi:hypothetical protein